MTHLPTSWDLYKSLLYVIEEGSFSAAARKLGLKQSTVSRHVAELERELGFSLFTRSSTGLRPTDHALRLKKNLTALRSAADSLVRDAQTVGDVFSGTVRLTTNEPIGTVILPKVFLELQNKLPHIRFEISISDKFEDLLQREADIAIRVGVTKQQSILVKRVGEIEMGLYGSRDYLKRSPAIKTIADLDEHTIIGFDHLVPRVVQVMGHPELFVRDDLRYATDNNSMMRSLLDSGCGLAFCLIDKKGINPVRVLEDQISFKSAVSIAMHEDLKADRKLRIVFNELGNALKAALS